MRRFRMILSVLLCLCFIAGSFPVAAAKLTSGNQLQFNSNGKFKIVVFADCQDDAEPDRKMIDFMKYALDKENPDLVVFPGDNVVENSLSDFRTGLTALLQPLVERNIPYAYTFGNHDDEKGVSKSDMDNVYHSVGNCLTYDADPNISGTGTCNLPILNSAGTDIAFNLWMIDSNTYASGGYDNVHQDQLNWYTQKSQQLEAQVGHKVNSIAFQHIIVPEAYNLLTEVPSGTSGSKSYGGKSYALSLNSNYASGYLGEFPCPPAVNSGQLATFAARGDVLGIVTGHDHSNSFVGTWNGIDLIQTAGMTFSSYGDNNIRGYRTLTIDESDTSTYETEDYTFDDYYGSTGTGLGEYYYPSGTTFIASVATAWGDSVSGAKTPLTNGGFTVIDMNLNNGAGGKYIYMGYKTTTSYGDALKAIRFYNDGSNNQTSPTSSKIMGNNCNFYIVNEYGDGLVDLNMDAGGNYIYTYITRDYKAGPAMTAITCNTTETYSNYIAAVSFSDRYSASDLNKGCGGDYIYCHYKSTLSEVDSSRLRTAVSSAASFSELEYTASSWNNLISAVSAATPIISALDTYGASTYTQANINSAADAIENAINSLEFNKIRIIYDNMFSLNGWENSRSYNVNHENASLSVDTSAKTISLTGVSVVDTYTDYPSANGAAKDYYLIPVSPLTTYTFSYDAESTAPTQEVQTHIFGVGENKTALENSSGGWITGYNYSGACGSGKKSISYNIATSSECHYVAFRFGTTSAVASTTTFSNIKFLKSTDTVVSSDCADIDKLVTPGQPCGELAVPTRTGYTFAGWFTEQGGNGTRVTANTVFPENGDVTVYSTWTLNKYALLFDVNHSGINENLFALGSEFQLGVTVNGVTATYNQYDGTVTFNGTAVDTSSAFFISGIPISFETGEKYTLSATYVSGSRSAGTATPVFELYDDNGSIRTEDFMGSYLDLYTTGTTSKTIEITDSIKPTRYVLWLFSGNTVTYSNYKVRIKLEKSDSATEATPNGKMISYGGLFGTLPTVSRTGYSFNGWFDSENVPVTSSSVMQRAANKTVYAHWQANTHTFTYIVDGAPTPVTYSYGDVIATPTAPEKTGYTFKGWSPNIPQTMPDNDVTVTAQWQIKTHTFTYIVDGVPSTPVTYNYGTAIATPRAPEKTGYTFKGWSPKIPQTMPDNDVTVTAQWQIKTHTFTYIVDGASTPVTYNYGDVIAIPTAPEKTGYTFKGWSPNIPQIMPDNDVTVTAQWQINTHTFTYIVDGASTPVTYSFGDVITIPTAPEKTGYTFKGWSPNIPQIMPDNDVTVTAQWEEIKHKITFTVGGEIKEVYAARNIPLNDLYGEMGDISFWYVTGDYYMIPVTVSGDADMFVSAAFDGPQIPWGIVITGDCMLNVGQSAQLSAAATAPINAVCGVVTWSSENTAIITVSETGIVTAVSGGNAAITATDEYGNTARFGIQVKSPDASVRIFSYGGSFSQKISWWKSYSTATMRLGFIAYNCGTSSRCVWSSDNSRVKVDSNGNITNIGSFSRSAKITLTVYDASENIIAKSSVTVCFYKFGRQKTALMSQSFDGIAVQSEALSEESAQESSITSFAVIIMDYILDIFKNTVFAK